MTKARLASGFLALALACGVLAGESQRALILVGRIDTGIHAAAANYLKRLIAGAEKEGASLIVLELSTPGGGYAPMREMTSAILGSKVPIAVFVFPSGSSAASAGFFLLESGDVAAMAPGTNTGAAHPVASGGEDLPKTMNEKAEQDARALIRSLARQRGRNTEKAEAAVTSSTSYTETEAKEAGLIEVIARDVADLVSQLDGRTVKKVDGKTAKLALGHPRIETREMGQIEKLLGAVSNPNVAVILMLLGVVGLYMELKSPGAILPGVVGGIALLLAFYAFSYLPVNYVGVALILFGFGLFIAEVKVASHGILAVGGAVSLLVGSLLLFSSPANTSGYRVDLAVLLPGILLTLSIVLLLTWKTVQLRRMPARTGVSGMIGEAARVVEPFPAGRGRVFVEGEYWDAEGPSDLTPGESVRIVRVEGLKLIVERRS
jgi:membrane-bound serine protease (ClpP class)